MNQALEIMAAEFRLQSPENEELRMAFGYVCVARVQHLLEDAEVIGCLEILRSRVRGEMDADTFGQARQFAERLANQHRGSKSIDGCGHAAVSASYAVANALGGKALQAASYAAYATVYADGGYGAVAHREAFELEFAWQVNALRELTTDVGGFRCRSTSSRLAP